MSVAAYHSDDAGASRAAPFLLARLTADEPTTRRLASVLGECIPDVIAASAACLADGSWAMEAILPDTADLAVLRAAVDSLLPASLAETITIERLDGRDWVSETLASLPPVSVGRFTVHGRHDRARIAANRIGIEIEAGLAFGTGHHGTTRGCLAALDRHLRSCGTRRVLDLGTGSGVLAIAAARIVRRRVVASDSDAAALAVARANARANGAGTMVETVHARGFLHRRLSAPRSFDLVMANILLRPLMQLARPLSLGLERNGRAVLSGLLPHQANATLHAGRACGFALERRFDIDGWTTLVLLRSGTRRYAKSARPVSARPLTCVRAPRLPDRA
jgi:ribosomal protein L11 methyltransferase